MILGKVLDGGWQLPGNKLLFSSFTPREGINIPLPTDPLGVGHVFRSCQ